MLTKFKKYLQSLSLRDQSYEINEMIEYIDNTNIKMTIELKKNKGQFITISVDTKISAHKFGAINIMRKINPKCSNKDSFMYSITMSLHY